MTTITNAKATEARIITLHQPWASAIALGFKKYETRSWHTDYTGPLVIHAAKQDCKPDEMERLEKQMKLIGQEKEWERLKAEVNCWVVYGAIVAVSNLTDRLLMVDDPIRYPFPGEINIEKVPPMEKALGDWKDGRFAWKLEDVRPIKPTPWKGAQGLRKFFLLDSLEEDLLCY